MKIAILGDLHGEFAPLYSLEPGTEMCLIAGDFGGVFSCSEEEHRRLKSLENLPFEIAYVDGNHDNTEFLSSLPLIPWNEGLVHRVAENVVHLPRGEVFHILRKTFFCFGGGVSTDRGSREEEGLGYWKREMPIPSEYDYGLANLAKENHYVDYILTHTAPKSCAKLLCEGKLKDPAEEPLCNCLEDDVRRTTDYKAWFCGHFHCDKYLADQRLFCLYKQPKYIEL